MIIRSLILSFLVTLGTQSAYADLISEETRQPEVKFNLKSTPLDIKAARAVNIMSTLALAGTIFATVLDQPSGHYTDCSKKTRLGFVAAGVYALYDSLMSYKKLGSTFFSKQKFEENIKAYSSVQYVAKMSIDLLMTVGGMYVVTDPKSHHPWELLIGGLAAIKGLSHSYIAYQEANALDRF